MSILEVNFRFVYSTNTIHVIFYTDIKTAPAMGLLTYILDCGHLRRVKLSLLANVLQQETGEQPTAAVEIFRDRCVVLVPANILIRSTQAYVAQMFIWLLTEQDGRRKWAWPQYVLF